MIYIYRIKKNKGEKLFDFFNVSFMIVVCFMTIYPFWYCTILAFNQSQDSMMGGIWFWPREFTFDNIAFVLARTQLKTAYIITILRTVIGSLYTLTVTGLAAYAISKRKLPGRNAILLFMTIPLFIGGTMVSNYVIMSKLHLLNNFLIYILPGGFAFFFMIILRSFINQLPDSLEESAKLDGAGYFTIFFKLILPLCIPVVATILLFCAVGHWLDFSTNLIYISKPKLMTVQYFLYLTQVQMNASAAMNMDAIRSGNQELLKQQAVSVEAMKYATLVVVTFPILFAYPFFQKYFIKGIMIGAIRE